MPEPGRKSLPIDEITHKQIKVFAAEHGEEMQALIRKAWEAYLSTIRTLTDRPPTQDRTPTNRLGTDIPSPYGDSLESLMDRHPHGDDLRRLLRILDSGVQVAITAIKSNLLAFDLVAEMVGEETSAKGSKKKGKKSGRHRGAA